MSNKSQKRRNRVCRQPKHSVVRIPRNVWDVIATQTTIMLQQALLMEQIICTRNEEYLRQNQ